MDSGKRDEDLVQAALGGNKDAFGVLLIRHQPLLSALCRRALQDDGMAEDAAQEASLQALLSLDRLRRPERFGPWLAGIGLNVCHRMRRARSRDAWSWEAVQGGRLYRGAVDESAGPHEMAEAAELRESVWRAVGGLPNGQRAAVTLHYLAGLPQAETAMVLDIDIGAVKTRLHRARARLRVLLEQERRYSEKSAGVRTMVTMNLVDVRRRAAEEGEEPRHIVVLEEVGGPRRLTFWIGAFEASALALQLEGIEQPPRPLTYAFAASLLQAAGGRLHEVQINRLEGDVFYASAIVDAEGGRREVDARPSDALNLALLLSAPIRVNADVLAATAGEREGEAWVMLQERSEGPSAIVAELLAEWEAGRSTRAKGDPAEEA